VNISARVSKETKEKLEKMAEEQDRTLSSIVSKILDKECKHDNNNT